MPTGGLPGITGIEASLNAFNGWFAGWKLGLINELNVENNITVNLARAVAASKGWM